MFTSILTVTGLEKLWLSQSPLSWKFVPLWLRCVVNSMFLTQNFVYNLAFEKKLHQAKGSQGIFGIKMANSVRPRSFYIYWNMKNYWKTRSFPFGMVKVSGTKTVKLPGNTPGLVTQNDRTCSMDMWHVFCHVKGERMWTITFLGKRHFYSGRSHHVLVQMVNWVSLNLAM